MIHKRLSIPSNLRKFLVSRCRVVSYSQWKAILKRIFVSYIIFLIILSFFYLICLKLGWIPYFQFILRKVGGQLETRVASFLRGLVVIIGGRFAPSSAHQCRSHTPHRKYDVPRRSFWRIKFERSPGSRNPF